MRCSWWSMKYSLPLASTAAPEMEKKPLSSFSNLAPGITTAERLGGNIQHGKYSFANFQVMGYVLNRVLVRKLADAQKSAAAVFVTNGVPALCIHRNVAKMNIFGLVKANGCGERRARACYSIAMVVGDGYIIRPIEFQGQGVGALACFLFRLRGVHVPVLHVIELDLVPHVVFVRKLVNVTGRLGVGNVKSRLSEGIRSPDIGECAAASIDHPNARVLPVPTLVQIGISGVVVVVRIRAAAVAA